MRADWDQRAAEAKPVGRLGDLLEVGEVRRPYALVAAEIGAVAADGNEPEDVQRFVRFAHDGARVARGVQALCFQNQTMSRTAIGAGMRPSRWKRSATACC